MAMIGIYRILSEQDDDLDLGNKKASLDALSNSELSLIRLSNKHRIFRRKPCLFCGSDLQHEMCKTGKEKQFCGRQCGERYLLFYKRLEFYRHSDMYKLRLLAEYFLIQLIFRVPADDINERLKKACRKRKVLKIEQRM